jgi:hypothetical protein
VVSCLLGTGCRYAKDKYNKKSPGEIIGFARTLAAITEGG